MSSIHWRKRIITTLGYENFTVKVDKNDANIFFFLTALTLHPKYNMRKPFNGVLCGRKHFN